MPETTEPCWMCGATPSMYRFDCPECCQRWEDNECQELRERLFPVVLPKMLPK